MRAAAALAIVLALGACGAGDQATQGEPDALAQAPTQAAATDPVEKLIARAKSLELDTPYTPPPGDIQAHETMGFARTLCSAVFVSGLDEDFAAENVGFFTSPLDSRGVVTQRVVDREGGAVHLALANGTTRTSKYIGDLGCVPLPSGATAPFFEPPTIATALPEASSTPWPLGDLLPEPAPLPGLDTAAMTAALDMFFPDGAMTAAVVITHRGQIVAERYAMGGGVGVPLESWSMGKSLTATMVGVLIQQGVYALDQAAPIPEWQSDGDPRAEIHIRDILQMSSGLRCRAPQDPDADPTLGYYDHLYLYTGAADSFAWAATRPQQWPPGTVGRYRNCDPVLANYLVRLGVEGRGDDYHQFPQTHLFDPIGVRNLVFQTDPHGNILLQGSDLGSARDWARLGNLYLNDGMAGDERVLPAGFANFVSSLAPAWQADQRPIYGGFFWLWGADYGMAPGDVYAMAGAGGQTTMMVPSKELVIVRLGHYGGAGVWTDHLRGAVSAVLEAVDG